MLTLAAISLIGAALVGSAMAWRHFQKQRIPWPMPVAHGVFVAAGLALLATYLVTTDASAYLWTPFGLFVLAAFGGGLILKAYLRRNPLPSTMVIIHGMLAAMGLLFLLGFLYAQNVADAPQEVRDEYYDAVREAH